MNPQPVIDREEFHTASLKERLEAVKRVLDSGYKIGFHFDPIIITENWRDLYSRLISEIAGVVDPDNIAWWSLGALRFPEELKEHIFKFKDSGLFEGELIKGYDGKYRYFKPMRLELFLFITRKIKHLISESMPLYLCMEHSEVWEEVLPNIYPDERSINKYLYQSALS